MPLISALPGPTGRCHDFGAASACRHFRPLLQEYLRQGEADAARSTRVEYALAGDVHACSPMSLSCVLVSKSLASCRSRNWLEGVPLVRLTFRPRATAGRAKIGRAHV